MARAKKRTPKVEEVRPYVEGVAKNLVDKLYGPDGPAWGTKLTEIEDLLLALREMLTEKMLGDALARQASAQPRGPSAARTCLSGMSAAAGLPRHQRTHPRYPRRRSRMGRTGRLLRPLPAVFFSLSPRAWALTRAQ